MYAPARHKRRRGAHMVEFALVAPVFFLFFFGLIDLGRGLMVSSLLTNAARTGCRAAVVPGRTTDDVKTTVNSTVQGQGLGNVTTTVLVNGVEKDASGAASRDTVTVVVGVPYSEVTWLPSTWFVKGNLNGQFTLARE